MVLSLIPMKNIESLTLSISEIFHSLQGEGSDIGLPTIFIRLAECNLRCTYCDTTYAQEKGTTMIVSDIISHISEWKCKRVCITGGEPLLQKNVYNLIDVLLADGYQISVETNGSIDIANLKKDNVVIKMDIKLPSSNMQSKMDMNNISLLRPIDEVKFIIGTKGDYEYAKRIMQSVSIPCSIIMQSVWQKAPELAQWILDDDLEVRFSIQLHKILWGENRRR